MAKESDRRATSYMNRCAIAATYATPRAPSCSVVELVSTSLNDRIVQSIELTPQTMTRIASTTDEHRKHGMSLP